MDTRRFRDRQKTYSKPKLSEHGNLKSITRGGSCQSPDYPEGGGDS